MGKSKKKTTTTVKKPVTKPPEPPQSLVKTANVKVPENTGQNEIAQSETKSGRRSAKSESAHYKTDVNSSSVEDPSTSSQTTNSRKTEKNESVHQKPQTKTRTQIENDDSQEHHASMHGPVFEDDLDISTIIERVEIVLGTWIQENLNGNNIRGLITQTPGVEKFGSLRNDLLNLYEIAQHLNLELLNMFDNYLCFAGTEDQSQLKRLSSMASTRAKTALAAKNPTYSILLDRLFDQISKKLCDNYADENRKISNQESGIAGDIANEIFKEYDYQIRKYIKIGASNIDEIHSKLVQYSLGVLDRVLDFSAKMNHIHTTTSDRLEDKLNQRFVKLNQKYSSKPIESLSKTEFLSKLQSKVVLNSRRLLVEAEVAKYHEAINSGWPTQKDCKALEILHEIAVKTIGTNLPHEDRFAMYLQIERYFAQVCNHFEVQKGKNEGSGKCVTVYFTDTEVHVGVITTSGQGWNYRVNGDKFPLPKFLGSKTPIPKLIQMLKTQKPSERVKSREYIVNLLKRVKTQAETKAAKVGQICLIIPTWFQLGEISELRDMTLRAGYKRTFCIRESCAVVYAAIKDSTPAFDMYVVITAHHFNINIDIFQIQNKKTIQLVSLAAFEDENPNKYEEAIWSPVYSTIVLKSDLQSKTSGFCGRFLQKLNEMFEAALGYLSEPDRNKEKGCFFMCNHSSLEQVFDLFLEDKTRLLHKLTIHSQLVWNQTLTSLAKNPSLLSSKIIDYVVLTPEQSASEQKNESEEHSVDVTRDSVSVAVDTDRLLEKCRLIREHLETGKVRLGVLMVKLVRQALEQAEFVAKDEEASEEEILEQCAKVDGIISQHKFDIPL